MFFEKLSFRQKTSLLALAKRMMIADAKVRIEEDVLFSVLKIELGPGIEPTTQEIFGEIDVSAFDDKFSRLVLLLTLVIMANIDDNYHPTESTVLAEVSEELGFSDELVAKVMDIAVRQGTLVKEVSALFKQ